MGWARLAIAVLTAALIPQLVASSPIERVQPNSTLDVLRECRHDATAVHCDLKDWPDRQVTLTATSLPKDIRYVTVKNVKELAIEANAITSLAHLEVIKLFNIGTLTVLTRSLARDNETHSMDLLIHDVQNFEVHKETFSKWRSQSKVHISNVEYLHLLDKAFASTRLRSLSIQNITSLKIEYGAFSAASSIDNMRMTEITSLAISTEAVTSNITMETTAMADIDAPSTTTALSTTTAPPTTSVLATTSSKEDKPTLQPQNNAANSAEQGTQTASHIMHQYEDATDNDSSHDLIAKIDLSLSALTLLIILAVGIYLALRKLRTKGFSLSSTSSTGFHGFFEFGVSRSQSRLVENDTVPNFARYRPAVEQIQETTHL